MCAKADTRAVSVAVGDAAAAEMLSDAADASSMEPVFGVSVSSGAADVDASDSGEVFVISVAAELAGMHAQTLRTYDRLGLVSPKRTRAGGRRYSLRDVGMLRKIQKLTHEDGVNLAGIKAIISLTAQRDRLEREKAVLADEVGRLKHERCSLRAELSAAHARLRKVPGAELVHVPRSRAVVVWSPHRGRRH